MSESYVIECRNLDSTTDIVNKGPGDWTTNLQQKLMIEDGDTIICRNTFVDTKSTANMSIVIPTDMRVTMSYYMWINNYRMGTNEQKGVVPATYWTTNPTTSITIPLNFGDGADYPGLPCYADCQHYIMCETLTGSPGTRHVATQACFTNEWLSVAGGFWVGFQYYPPTDDPTKPSAVSITYSYVPTQNEQSGSPIQVTIPVNATYDSLRIPAGQTLPIECYIAIADPSGNPYKLTTSRWDINVGAEWDSGLKYMDMRCKDIISVPFDSDNVFTPALQSFSFTLPAGRYSPDDLTTQMNRLMTKLGPNSSDNNLSDNPLLVQVGGKTVPVPNPKGDDWVRDMNYFWPVSGQVPSAAEHPGEGRSTYGFSFNVTDPKFEVYVGASQMELIFDPDNQRFAFNYAHMPIYQDGAEAVGFAVGGTPIDDGGAEPFASLWAVGAYSGVYFNSLTCTRIDNGKDFPLWGDILGFNVNPLLPNGKPNPDYMLIHPQVKGNLEPVGIGNAHVPWLPVLPVKGQHYTSGFQGLDTAIQKGNASETPTSTPFYTPPSKGAALFSTSTDTVRIIGGKSILSVIDPNIGFGYFLIECTTNLHNNFITENENKSNIVAIVSRYYTSASYTTGASDASLVYTHHGNPQLLNSFKCRILNSDKTIAVDIGSDNTIFFELIKKPKPTPQQLELMAEEEKKLKK